MAPPLVFRFIGIVFTSIFYGIYCLIFGLYWRIQLKRTERSKGILLYPLTASFILCTAFFIILIFEVQFLITNFVLDQFTMESEMTLLWLNVAGNALYTAIDLISQLILLYRCWIMWRQLLVMIIPCILTLAFLVTALTTLGISIGYIVDGIIDFPPWYQSAVTAFFSISLGVNTLATALIVYKIVMVYNDIRGLNIQSVYGSGKRDLYPRLYPLLSILIESGLITFVAQLAQSIMYKTTIPGFPLISGSVVMLYGISTTVVLVRVELGITYDHHNTSKTAHSTNSRRAMQLAPYASKLNQVTPIDVEARASYDTQSERKLISPN